jgi:small-conductance mechanosensitive channel
VILVIVCSWAAQAIVRYSTHLISRFFPAKARPYLLPWIPIFRLGILILALWIVVPLLIHPTRENMLAALGASALAIGFSFKDYISSLIAGVAILFERTYRVGDWIDIGDNYGEIKKIGFRAVMLNTVDDTEVIIPHSKIWNNTIRNASSGNHDLMCNTSFYLNPNHDADKARSLLLELARNHLLTVKDKTIKVTVKELPWATLYILRAYVNDSRSQFEFMSDLTVKGKAILLANNFEPAHIFPTTLHQEGK